MADPSSSNAAQQSAANAADHHNNDGGDTWRNQLPYQLALSEASDTRSNESSATGTFDKKLEASCHCGRVRYWISRDKPLVAKFCHCGGCQKLHGAPFQWAAIFHKTDILFEHGSKGIQYYNSGSHQAAHDLPCKLSCDHCRAPIMDEGRRMILLFPTLIDFSKIPSTDDGHGNGERSEEEAQRLRDGFYPDCHIFYGDRKVDIPDGKPKWKGLDGADGILCDKMP